jgi:hypothetical protein
MPNFKVWHYLVIVGVIGGGVYLFMRHEREKHTQGNHMGTAVAVATPVGSP